MENKTMHFGKSWFMATMEIRIHEVKISISHFMSSKKDQSQVKKYPLPFINVTSYLSTNSGPQQNINP